MILSAGFGQRMLPLSLTLPKPALPVLGRPIVVQTLHRLARSGVREAVLNLHHLAGMVRRMFGPGVEAGLPLLRFSFEETILGTAGGLGRAAPLLRGAGPILIHNADFVSDIDVAAAAETHRRSGLLATLVLAPAQKSYSTVEIDPHGRVLSLAGKPEADPAGVAGSYLFTGCHFIDETLLDRIPADRPSDMVRDIYRPLVEEGRLGSVIHDGFWWEFGSPALYLEGTARLLDLPAEKRREIARHDPVHKLDLGVAAIGTGAQFHESARIEGRCALGFASYVSEGTRLEDCVVMPEAWIGPDCRLGRCIVAPAVEVPAGFEMENSIICGDPGPETEIPDWVRRVGGLIVGPLEPGRVAG